MCSWRVFTWAYLRNLLLKKQTPQQWEPLGSSSVTQEHLHSLCSSVIVIALWSTARDRPSKSDDISDRRPESKKMQKEATFTPYHPHTLKAVAKLVALKETSETMAALTPLGTRRVSAMTCDCIGSHQRSQNVWDLSQGWLVNIAMENHHFW